MTDSEKNRVSKDICEQIKTVCKTYGKRSAGSEGEKQTAAYFAEQLSACADEVKTESFKFAPEAYLGWTVLSVTCSLLAVASYFFSAMLSLMLFVLALVPYVFEYVLYKRMLDPLYAQAESQNVIAVKKSLGETKKRLYFVAHIDASREYTIKYRLGSMVYVLQKLFSVLGVLYFIALSIARWAIVGEFGAGIASGATLWSGLAGLIFLIPFCASYFFVSRKNVTDGANDGLSGCFVALEALRSIKDISFEDVEIGVILVGASCAGLRGSKSWCDVHANDYEDATFIVLNAFRELQFLNVGTKDMTWNYGVRSNDEVVKLVLDAANSVGINCSARPNTFGVTDSAAFSQNGLKSASLTAINKKLPDYYHTRYDSYDNLSEECIAESFCLVNAIISKFTGSEDAPTSSETTAPEGAE